MASQGHGGRWRHPSLVMEAGLDSASCIVRAAVNHQSLAGRLQTPRVAILPLCSSLRLSPARSCHACQDSGALSQGEYPIMQKGGGVQVGAA